MNDGEARRKRIDEENISTADRAGARTDSASDRQAERARTENLIDAEPESQEVRAVEVQRTDVTAQAVPVHQAGSTASGPSGASTRHSDEPERGPLFSSEEAANL